MYVYHKDKILFLPKLLVDATGSSTALDEETAALSVQLQTKNKGKDSMVGAGGGREGKTETDRISILRFNIVRMCDI